MSLPGSPTTPRAASRPASSPTSRRMRETRRLSWQRPMSRPISTGAGSGCTQAVVVAPVRTPLGPWLNEAGADAAFHLHVELQHEERLTFAPLAAAPNSACTGRQSRHMEEITLLPGAGPVCGTNRVRPPWSLCSLATPSMVPEVGRMMRQVVTLGDLVGK